MNKRNTKLTGLTSIALAAAALAVAPMSAQAGDIYSIEPVWGDETSGRADTGDCSENPLTLGEQATFIFRLYDSGVQSNPTVRNDTSNFWRLNYKGAGSVTLAELSGALPKIGVYVSGRMKFADIVDVSATKGYEGNFSDIKCRYTVEGGDIALPLTLADSNGNEIGSADTSATYYFLNPYEWWAIEDKNGNPVSLSFGSESVAGLAPKPTATRNYSLASIDDSIYIRAVDFDEEYDTSATPTYWRRVYEGMTTTKTSQPSIYVPGGNSTNETTVLYLWVENTNAVSLADATLTYSDTVRRGGTDVDLSFPIQKITLGKGQTNLTFRLQGVTAGETAEVFLAATKGYRKNAVGDIITNFVTRTVYCEDAPDPFVSISFAKDETEGEIEATTNYTKSAVTMYVQLSKEYTEDIWVDINPSVVGDAAFDVFEEKVIGVSLNDGNYNNTFTNRLVKVPAGEKQVPFYVYALGATADTAAYEGGITFTPTLTDPRNSAAARAFFNGEFVFSRLRVTDQAPIIVSPEDGKSYSGWVAQGDQLVSLKINDNYRDLLSNSTYTVTWSYGDGSVDTFTITPTNRLLNVTVKYPTKGDFSSTVTVTDQNGNVSNEINLNVTVLAPKTVTANLYDSTSQTTKNERSEYAEGEKPLLKFELSQPHTATLYAFLVPLNAASSNLVTSAAFEGGIVIQPNTTLSTPVSFNLNFLDGGTAAADLQFGIMLRNADRYDQGEEVTGVYTPETLYIYATNVAPTVTSVEINNGHVENGGTFESKISSGVPTRFDATLFDPALVDITNGLVTCWTIRDGMAGHYVYKKFWVTNDTVNTSCTYTFATGGETQTVTVRAQDKDMLDLGPEYTFTVEIDAPPYVQIINSNADRHYAENSKDGYLIAALSTPASDELVIELTAARQGLDGILEFATNYVTIAAGDTMGVPQNVRFSDLDGTVDSKTAGFIVTARVITDTLNVYGQPWSDYYRPGTEYVFVDNVAPVIHRPSESSITNKVTLNSEKVFNWDIRDIAEDLTNGLTVTWTSSGGESTTFTGPDVATGSYTNTFTSEGPLEVSVLVEDKDGGQAMRTWYFVVNPTKKVTVNPYGPAASTLTKYDIAKGRGKGRVWGDSGTYEISSFLHTWVYDVGAAQAQIYAFGYAGSTTAAGYNDDGNLGPGKMDVAITSTGDKWVASASAPPYYNYKDKWDNFFYCWFDVSSTGCLDGENVTVSGVPHPAVSPLAPSRVTVALAAYEEGTNANKVVETRNIEAIFAREKFVADNMGDINADGIPDFYYKSFWYGGADAGGGFGGGSEADDLTDLSYFNDDNDFLPGAGAASSALIPGLPETWATEGRPFTAYLEIRGFGDGLNDAPSHWNFESQPDLDFKSDSYTAMMNKWRAEKGVQGLEWIGVEWLAYNELTDAEKAEWSPENPTDPTKEDTDGDGFTDGYEYYYWYYAKVGYIDELTKRHVYLTGSKYNPADPAKGDVITSAQIVEMFDPNVYNDKAKTRDTDNDGLTDLQEFYLGTNPIQWDTDGDGLPDGYEVMIGMNPLVEATTPGTHDAYTNSDGDYMAYSLIGSNAYDKDFRVFGVEDGGRVKYVAIRSDAEITTQFTQDPQAGWLVTVDDGNGNVSTYITLGDETGDVPYDFNPDGDLVLKCELDEFRTWRARTNDDGDWVRAEPVFLPRGTYLAVDPDPTVTWYNESFTMSWNETDPLPNHAWRAWRYGKNSAPLCENCGGSGRIVDYSVIPAEEIDCPTCDGTGFIYGSGTPTWGGFALGQDLTLSPGLVVLFEVNKPIVALIHYHVYQWRQFDPRTAWGGPSVNTRAFATYDEFLLISFFYNAGTLSDSAINVSPYTKLLSTWGTYNTNPLAEGRSTDYGVGMSQTVAGSGNHGADTDGDGVPDGWELYVMSGPMNGNRFKKIGDPVRNTDWAKRGPFKKGSWSNRRLDEDDDTLGYREEFESVESTIVYSGSCPTIQRTAGWTWYNKRWPTDPWSSDTDDDGLYDDEEQSLFSYGTPRLAGYHNGAVEGGGLNPLSWDTDGDGLPDPWEAQYKGTDTPISARTGKEPSSNSGDEVQTREIVNGMDGTSADETTELRFNVLGELEIIDRDYDHDGLQNWQEYQTGMMRCWRYDDPISPWDKMPDFGDTSDPAFDWGNVLLNRDDPTVYNPHLSTVYDPTAYYCSLQTNEWDSTGYGRWYMFPDGPYHELRRPQDKYNDGTDKHNRWTFYAKHTLNIDNGTDSGQVTYIRQAVPIQGVYAEEYFSCSPINHDSDDDGMDDYYECFHGMNPILGGVDLIASAYGNQQKFGALNSYRSPEATYNFVFEPWLAGLPTADPDGDNIRNQEEAIMPQVQALSTWHHTDPTPLWMTDTSYEPGANIDDDPGSLTVRFYQPSSSEQIDLPGETFDYDSDGDGVAETHRFEMFADRYDRINVVLKQWQYSPAARGYGIGRIEVGEAGPVWYATTMGEEVSQAFYSFEENEGYDSDHDGLSDYAEAEGKYRNASDGQDDDSPSRHQAMYFNGTDAFLETLPEAEEGGEGAAVNNMQEMMFLEYTAEAWVLPEDLTRAQTILERAIATGPSHVGDEKLLRRNFSIGINAAGNWYALHDSRGTDKLQTIVVTGPKATDEWTHLAVTFGAKAGSPAEMTLYVNGRAVNTLKTNVQPENGTSAITIDTNGVFGTKSPYSAVALLVGTGTDAENDTDGQGVWALATRREGQYPDYDNFTGYFKGYVDEVRVWDGARSAAQIAANYKKRFTADDIRENRSTLYYQWQQYGVRSDAANEDLEPELRYLFGFDHSFGADSPEHVAKVPAGFDYSGVDGKGILSRPDGWVCPWWDSLPCKSTVYNNYAWVPWINNMYHHLDRFDGSTKDSRYWSKYYAGVTSAPSLELSMFSYPQTHEVYSIWNQAAYGLASKYLLYTFSTNATDLSMSAPYVFARRQQLTEGADLLPFGGAYVKYTDKMWDDGKASSMWEITGTDSDNDGLPDWWEAEYGDVGWTDIVTYNGVEMEAGEAYKRSLAAGAHEGSAAGDALFAQKSDLDKDGMADWWEEVYKIENEGGDDDADQDGLSNYSEYVISEAFRSLGIYLSPVKLRSDDVTLDYFRTIGSLYIGEMFTDHDMMEDEWERSLDDLDYVSPWVWDASFDKDEDGWSAFAECRYHYFRCSLVANLISHVMGEEEVRDIPRPTVRATFRYHGSQSLVKAGSENSTQLVNGIEDNNRPGATFYVNAYSSYNPASGVGPLQIPDATFKFSPGETVSDTLYLGAWEDRVVHVTFAPGYLDLDSLKLEVGRVPRSDTYSWSENGEPRFGTYAQYLSAMRANPNGVVLATEDFNWSEMMDHFVTVTTDSTGVKGYICFNGERAGWVDLQTGEASIDLAPLQQYYTYMAAKTDAQGNQTQAAGAAWSMTDAVLRMSYSSKVPATQKNNLTISLSKPDSGYLKEGLTTFVAFADLNNDGKYTPGEPMGMVRNVDVGWGTSEFCVELTDTNPVFARVRLSDLVNDREVIFGSESSNVTNVVPGTLSGGQRERIRVIRTSVDGYNCSALSVPYRQVLDKWVNLDQCRDYIFEGDFLSDEDLDLDWQYFASEVVNNTRVKNLRLPLTNIVYRVVLGNGSTDAAATATNNLLGISITRQFDNEQVVPTPVSPLNGTTIYSARPTFEWSLGELNTYTAFRIRVYSGSTVVYTSGYLPLPARNSRGNYEWTAPICANCIMPSGKMFTAGENYSWAVSVYNSKFTTDAYCAYRSTGFRMNTNATKPVADNGYTSIGVNVSYFGPEQVLAKVAVANTAQGKVRVQAFATPDFSGDPTAETVATSLTADNRTENVLIPGLPKGEWYIRAFVDWNGNSRRDAWESWGYACNREGTVSGYSRFSPVPVVIDEKTVDVPQCDVYIEDCDTDGDWFPDAYEMATKSSLTTLGPVTSSDGLVNVNPDLATSISHELAASLCTMAGPDLDTLQDPEMAALILGVNPGSSSARVAVAKALNAQTIEPDGVQITSISVADGVVNVTSDVDVTVNGGGLSGAKAIYTGQVSGEVVYKVWYKKNLTDADWTLLSTQTKHISESGEVVSEIQVTGTIDPESGFFKVTIE